MVLMSFLGSCGAYLAVFVLLTGFTACSSQGAATYSPADQPGQSIMISPLKETQFYAFDEDLEESLIDDLIMTDFQGVALQAPPIVDLDKHDKIPVLVVRQNDGIREQQFPFDFDAYVVGVNLDSGEFGIVRGLRDPSGDLGKNPAPEIPRGDEPIDPDIANNLFTDLTMIDAHSLMAIPLEPGRYSLSLLWVDWLAKPVTLTLVAKDAESPSAKPMSDEETRGLLDDFQEIIGDSVVQWRPSSSLQRPGVGLHVPENQQSPGSEILIQGTALLQPGRGQMNQSHIAEAESKLPAGFANTTIMVVSAAGGGIWQIDLPIPIDGKHAGFQGDSAGYLFSMNLANFVPEDALKPGVLLAYMFAGPFATGPYRIQIDE